MLMLKLKKIGKKHQTTFRLIVDEKRHKLVGKNTEDLGWYNPHSKKLELNAERINYWMKVGAKPTDTVHNLLVKTGVIKDKKIAVHKQPKKPASAEAMAGKKEGETAISSATAAATKPEEAKSVA